MTRANFERVANYYNVAYTMHDKRRDVIECIIDIACASIDTTNDERNARIDAHATRVANDVTNDDTSIDDATNDDATIDTTRVVACANNDASIDNTTQHATSINVDDVIKTLLTKLSTCSSPLIKKRIRRQLRSHNYYISRQNNA